MFVALALCLFAQEEPSELVDAWDGFPAFVWREQKRGKPLPEGLTRAFGGTSVFRNEEVEWAFERGIDFYVSSAAGRDVLHLDLDGAWLARIEGWIETRDEELLIRSPCLSDPTTLARLEETLARTLAARDGRHGLGISLGDEVSLTPNGNPLDLCRSPTCLERWREHAEARGLPTRPPTTDEVRAALAADELAPLGPWLAFRRFHHAQLVALLAHLAAQVRSTSPGTPVGLLGLSGTTPFGGVPLRAAVELFDFVEVYPVGAPRYLALDGLEARFLATVFLQEESPAGAAWVVWEHWLRGGRGIVVWNDAELTGRNRSATAVALAVQQVRALQERYPDLSPPLAADVGLLEDDDSAHVSWLRDALLDGATWPRRFTTYQRRHGTRERRLSAWLHLLTDAGAPPRVVDSASPNWPSVLVLVDVHVIDQALIQRLEEHLEEGGTLVIDGRLGWIDREGHLLELQDLCLAADGLRDAPKGLERYVENRLDPARSRRLRSEALELIRQGEPPWPDVRLAGAAAEVPWLVRVRRVDNGEGRERLLYGFLPWHPSAEERAERLNGIEYEIALPDGWRLVEGAVGQAPVAASPSGILPAGWPLLVELEAER